MSPTAIPLPAIRDALRIDLPFFAIAIVVLAAGFASLGLSRMKSRDRLLLSLGVMAVLYAVRLLGENGLVRTAMELDRRLWATSVAVLTYLIPIPLALFARELLGKGWNRSIEIWVWAQVAFAVIAVPSTVLGGFMPWTDRVNAVLIVGGTVLMLAHVWVLPGVVRSLKWAGLLMGALVLLNNLGFRPRTVNLEPLGFLILLSALGYVAAQRAMGRERKLVEVEQELATARRIQTSILPRRLPQMAGLRVVARYEPMTAVAGDFYDFLTTGKGVVTILVADVSGHGVPAALVASMLKVCFAAQAPHGADPAKVLSGLNAMLRDVPAGQFVTAACAAIDPASGTVTYAGAGHPPALLVRNAGGELVELAENGLFIGPFPGATYSNVTVRVSPGDRLLLYTDGIVEATAADGEPFGQERLGELLCAGRGLTMEEWVARLFEKIAGPAQEDDLTVLVAEIE